MYVRDAEEIMDNMNGGNVCLFAELAVFALLSACAVPDLKRKQFPAMPAAAAAFAGIAVRFAAPVLPEAMRPGTVTDGFGGLLIGAAIVLLAFLSHQAIGSGDGLMIGACGSWLGMKRTLEIFYLAGIGAAFFAAALLVRKKAGRKDSMPFLPFLAAAQAVRILWILFGGRKI